MTQQNKTKLTPSEFDRLQPKLRAYTSEMESSYPPDYQRIDQKTRPVIDELNHFDGSDVIDIGSNFGMFSLLLSQHAKKVVGLERSPEISQISAAGQKFFSEHGYDVSNVEFVNQSLKKIKELEYDSLLMTLVLYHLSDKEVEILVNDACKKCDRAIIQCRPGRGIQFNSGKLTDHISRNNMYDGLYDISGCIRFLKDIGMTSISVKVSEELFGGEVFPVIVASK